MLIFNYIENLSYINSYASYVSLNIFSLQTSTPNILKYFKPIFSCNFIPQPYIFGINFNKKSF